MKINYKKLINYYRPYKKIFFLDLLLSAISAAVVLVIPLIVKYLMDNLILVDHNEAISIIFKSSLFIIIIVSIKFFCDYFTICYGHLAGAKMEADMRSELFNHYQKMSISFFDNNKIGDLLARLTTDLFNLSDFLHRFPEQLLQIIVRIGGVVIMFFVLDAREAIALLLIFLFLGIFLNLFFAKMKKAFRKNHEKLSEINSQVESSLSGIHVVKSFANEKLEIERFNLNNKSFVESQKNCFKIMGFCNSGSLFFITLILPVVAVSGLILFHYNEITNGTLLALLLGESLIIGPIFALIDQIELLQNSIAGFSRFCEILNKNSEIVDEPNATNLKSLQGKIKFKNVYFSYGSSNQILQGLNIEIEPGEHVAFVGPSGSGKSTICNLISRFYDVSSGQILIDDILIKNIRLKSLHKNIGFVQQDTFLFPRTIMENIQYGNPYATFDKVVQAAKNAYIHDYIMSLKNGYNTIIGQKGINLSGGQRQRLAIARVFLKDPSILIFDEVTSNLDIKSEKFVQKSIDKLSENRTTITITHKLSTIKKSDKIIFFEDGKVKKVITYKKIINPK